MTPSDAALADDCLVSVVIPAFNQARYLREAVASVLAQSHSKVEVIVVDDGSTDLTREVCDSFADPRLRYVYQPNDGTYGLGARNHAILLAQGDWVALLDQDDRWSPDKLQRQLELASHRPAAGLLFCRVRFIDADGQVTGRQEGALPEGDVFHALLAKNHYYSPGGLFRRELLHAVGLPHAWVGMGDHALWLQLARRTQVAVVDDVLADYRIHQQGYQEQQRRDGMLRRAHDSWQLAKMQLPLLHRHCSGCRRAHARAMRGAAKCYVVAACQCFRGGRFAQGAGALRDAMSAAPGWWLQPWGGALRVVPLALAIARGLLSPLR